MAFEARQLRPLRDWAVLLEEKRKTVLSSGLVLTEKPLLIENVHECAGEVIAIGSSNKFPQLDLMPGRRVLYRGFLKYAHPLYTEETWADGSSKKFFLIKVDDICIVLGRDVGVGAFSSKGN